MFFKRRAQRQQPKDICPSLVTRLGHELNEPLSALNGLHDLLLKTTLSKEQTRYMAAMMDSTFKLGQTIQTITEVSAQEEQLALKSVKCHVLVIESEVLSARIFKRTLDKFELAYRLVHNLPEAIVALEESFQTGRPFTHILVDDALHSVTPKESAEYIHAALQHTTYRPQLILTSRELRSRAHEKVMHQGYDALLTKPLRETSLLAYLTGTDEKKDMKTGS